MEDLILTEQLNREVLKRANTERERKKTYMSPCTTYMYLPVVRKSFLTSSTQRVHFAAESFH